MFEVVKSHWKHWQNVQKLYCGWGLSLHIFYLRNRYMGSDRQGEGWAVGKYTGKFLGLFLLVWGWSPRHPPDILMASGAVEAARPSARPQGSPWLWYNCRKYLTTFEWLVILGKFKIRKVMSRVITSIIDTRNKHYLLSFLHP